jgi:hypothetical protein
MLQLMTFRKSLQKFLQQVSSKALLQMVHSFTLRTFTNFKLLVDVQQTSPGISSDQHSSETRSTYSMPPAFVPAQQAYSSSTATDTVKFPKQYTSGSQHPIHNSHPSAGSLVFGGYSDSNNSSPAPPLSAGGSQHQLPQTHNDGGRMPGPQFSNGSHIHSFSNGYSPMGPPPAGYYPRQDGYMNHNPGPDNFARRQMISFGPAEAYSPSGTPAGAENQRYPPYDQSTPHSFHGSQSSAPNDQEVNSPHFHPQYSTAVISNGSNGHVEDVRLYHQPRSKGRVYPQNVALPQSAHVQQSLVPPQILPVMDNLDGLVDYLQAQFAEPQFADYTLELRYSDDRATPVRIPGHNLLFARSPTLKKLMTAQAGSNSDGLTPRTLLIETDDRFLRSDAFWMAVQRLYGGPLLDPGASATASIPTTTQLSPSMPGTAADRFEVALGYAAAGHILQMPPVVNRGVDVAMHFIRWETMEMALDFALDGGLDSRWTLNNTGYTGSPSTYGPTVNMLIENALNFMITNFPPNFELDTSMTETTHNRRLPFIIENRPALPNPRLSSIKFGDHPSEDAIRFTSSKSPSATLSKILLNLPFPLLKYVLESSRLGNVQGWATTALRQKVMHSVIEEREKRRKYARENRTVSNAERKANLKKWEAVGWQESLAPPHGGSETPTLTQTWVDFLLPEGN